MMIATMAHRPWFHAAVAIVFVLGMAAGYRFAGGLDFVQGWGGGIAAVIATFFLVFKSQGYWAWMIVNAALWTYCSSTSACPMLAYLQISFLIFAGYGAVQWALVTGTRIGVRPALPRGHHRVDARARALFASLVVATGTSRAIAARPGGGSSSASRRARDRGDVDGRVPLPS